MGSGGDEIAAFMMKMHCGDIRRYGELFQAVSFGTFGPGRPPKRTVWHVNHSCFAASSDRPLLGRRTSRSAASQSGTMRLRTVSVSSGRKSEQAGCLPMVVLPGLTLLVCYCVL